VSFEGFHLDGLGLVIESLRRGDGSYAQGLAELIEDLAIGLEPVEGAPEGPIGDQGLKVQAEVMQGPVLAPAATAAQRGEQGLKLGKDLLRAAGRRQQGAIEGEAIALALLPPR
jgi:hypothetical protein